MRFFILFFPFVFLFGGISISNNNSNIISNKNIKIFTGSLKGTYYQIGKDIKRVCQKKFPNFIVVNTKGSLDNYKKLLTEDSGYLAIMQYDVLKYMEQINQKGYKKIKLVYPLYGEELHLIVKSDMNVNKLSDLNNKKVAIGVKKSGTWVTAKLLIEKGNLAWDTYEVGAKEGIKGLVNDKYDAVLIIAGAPTKLLAQLPKNASEILKLANLDDSLLDKLYYKKRIKANTYKFQEKDINTYAIKSVLVTYNFHYLNNQKIIKELFKCVDNNLNYLKTTGHKKWKEVNFKSSVNWPLYEPIKELINNKKIITFKKTFGGKKEDVADSIVQIKELINNKKIITFKKTFGGKRGDGAYSIVQTKDGGYIVSGYTDSFGAGGRDVWIIKLDRNGNKIWSKTFGGKSWDEAHSIVQTKDGGYILSGETYSFGAGKSDVWIIKLDRNGNKIWSKTFGGKNWDVAHSIVQTKDGGYVVSGDTGSFGAGGGDGWIIKLDRNGNKIWSKAFGGKNWDVAHSIVQTKDGGYIVSGYTDSFGAGGSDGWIIKLDRNGNKIWSKTFGGKKWDVAYSIVQTKDGGYIVSGYTKSFGAGGRDVWIIKLDRNGNKIWSKTFGSKKWDVAFSIVQTKDGGYIVSGETYSFGAGRGDVWIIKLDSKGNLK